MGARQINAGVAGLTSSPLLFTVLHEESLVAAHSTYLKVAARRCRFPFQVNVRTMHKAI